ncbi:hypothetical protein [Bdellovibrio sp. HCB2-146]|uniref:hypothetical protein n=1 Tax=Bdellovibrio sp. HCB2-146 TaxID=3394362 RepID=UPI0039BCF9EC
MFIILLYVPVARAYDIDRLTIQLYCSDQLKCSPQLAQKFDLAKISCESEVQSLGCAELAEKNPELAPLMRKCDGDSLCRQEQDYMKIEAGSITTNKDKACLRGYKNSLIDAGVALKDMSLSLKDLVADSWEKVKTNSQERAAFLKECNKSLLCKRDLVKDDHRYNNLSDEKLEHYTADFLYVESRDMKAYKSSLERVRHPAYVPISQRPQDDLDMPVEARFKLSQLAAIAKEKIKNQYTKYACYHPLAREEMECYAIGMVLDPTLAVGYFAKAGRAAVAARSLIRTEEAAAYARSGEAGVQALRAQKTARQAFVNRYMSYSPTSRQENINWISAAKNGASPKTVFVDVENSVMKKLNDTVQDKNLVTSLTNYQKELFFDKIKTLEQQFPGMKVERYSDFKSSRLAFSGNLPKDLDKHLERIFKETNDEFVATLKKENIIRQEDAAGEWFRGGIGNSADQSNLAARYSRTQDSNTLQSFSNPDLQTQMSGKVESVERDRIALRHDLKDTSIISGKTMHEDAFDIVRKNYGNTEKMKKELKQRFGLQSLPDGTVKKLERYVKKVDEFSPGIWIEAREFATLEDAVHGGISADMIGMGALNMKATAEALSKSKRLEKVLDETRTAEQQVTEAFKEQKKMFEDVVNQSLPPSKVQTVCSGDDCVVVARSALTKQEKAKIVSNLANTQYTGKFRMAFVNEGIKDGTTRTMLTTHGENIEKNLRKSLSGVMEPSRLKGITFAADMNTKELGRGPVDLLVGTANSIRLSKNEKKLIQEYFRKALQNLNADLGSKGPKGAYTPLQEGGW